MAILKSDNRRKEYKLVGASLPSRVHSYISLYAIAEGISKSVVIKQVLLGWIDTTPVLLHREEEHFLTKKIAKKIQIQWHIEKSKETALSLEEFNDKLREELLIKGIQKNYVRRILVEFNNLVQ